MYTKLFVFSHADDTVILGDNEKRTRKALRTWNNQCNEWNLEVNSSKTKALILGRRTHTQDYKYKYKNVKM